MNFRPILKKIYFYSLPSNALVRGIFATLDRMLNGLRFFWEWLVKTFWVEPRFRARHEAGKALWIENMPWISGDGQATLGDRVRISGKIGIAFVPSSGSGEAPKLSIGDRCFVGHGCAFSVARSIQIGKDCLIAADSVIRDNDGHPLDAALRRDNAPIDAATVQPVVIGDDVWIGNRATVLKGVTIGDRAVVASAAVVTKDVPPDTVVAGNPARPVKSLAAAVDNT